MNKSNIPCFSNALSFVAAIVLMSAPQLVAAQDEGPFFVTARLIDVASGREAHAEAALADISAALEAQGRDFWVLYERIRGDLPGYTVFTPDPDFNDLPPASLDPDMVHRIQESTNGNTYVTLAVDNAATTNIPEGAPVPEFMTVRVLNVPPANFTAFEAFLSDTVVPALREAGVMSRSARVVLGGSLGTFVIFVYSNEFPNNAGQMLMESMGQRDYDRMNEEGRQLVSSVEDIAYRYRADLSFIGD